MKKPATHPELKLQSDSKQFSAYFADLIPGFSCEEQEAELVPFAPEGPIWESPIIEPPLSAPSQKRSSLSV